MLRVVIVNLKRDRPTVNRRRVTESEKELRQGETEHKKIMSNHLDAVDYSRLFRCVRLSCFRHSTHTHTQDLFCCFQWKSLHFTLAHMTRAQVYKCTSTHTQKTHFDMCARAMFQTYLCFIPTESNIYSKLGASKYSYATLF